MPPLADTLLSLIERSDLTLKEIAEQANVPYQPLKRWVRGKRDKPGGRTNFKYDVVSADAVYALLNGSSYVEDAQ